MKFHILLLILHILHVPTTYAHCTTITSSKTFQKCMTLPTQQASIAWTFHAHNATLDLVFFSNFISPSGWVAWGINPTSPEMTGTRTLIAFPDPNSGQLVLLPYILTPSIKLQKTPLLSQPLDIHLVSSSAVLYGGKIATIHDGASVQIHATIRLQANKTKIHIVWNRGLYVQGYSPTIHPTTINDLSSLATIDVLSGASNSDNSYLTTLKTCHAILNTMSWGFLIPIGDVSARYLRHMQSLGSTPIWFYAHASVQLSAFLTGTVGFGIGIRLGQLSTPNVVHGLHRNIGIAVFCLGSLQALALVFRPKTTSRFRTYWRSYHHLVGYGCVVLGVVNCFEGFKVMGEDRSYAMLGFCLGVSTLVGVCVALEVNGWVVFCRNAQEEKMVREGVVVRCGAEKPEGSCSGSFSHHSRSQSLSQGHG